MLQPREGTCCGLSCPTFVPPVERLQNLPQTAQATRGVPTDPPYASRVLVRILSGAPWRLRSALKELTNLKTFSDFNLNPAILKSLEQEGYTIPTPIQTQAIPTILAGKDVQGIAQTGTGKTAAFALPILHRLAANKREPMRRGCRVLILTPTRELCSQICDSFRTYGRHLGIKVAAVYGGVGHRPQIDALNRGVDVLGRELELRHGRMADADALGQRFLQRCDAVVLRQDPERRRLGRGAVADASGRVTRTAIGRGDRLAAPNRRA